MKVLMVMLATTVVAYGYGYWDSFLLGARIPSLSAVSGGMCGATIPDHSSAMSVFINPSALAASSDIIVSASGWHLSWREEISYHYTCVEPYRYNMGSMIPKGAFAFAVPLGRGFTAGAGVSTVSQYQMKAIVQEYYEITPTHRELWNTMFTDAYGNISEVLVSLAGVAGPVSMGISPGIRYGSGGSTTYSNTIFGHSSSSVISWEHSGFALRAGASIKLGCNELYSTHTTGDERYLSFTNLGALSFLSFMNGGYLGAEAGFLDGDNLNVTAFTRLPGAIEGSSIYMGVNGYRPDDALKAGIGLSIGGDYSFHNYRVSAAYHFHSRYREGTAVPVRYINHVYDAGDLLIVSVDRIF